MSVPAYIQKTLVMKPEVTKIFEDLEKWHDHCRFEMINFDPKDLYKSKEYKDWSRGHDYRGRKEFKPRRDYRNGDRFSN
jgi:hypothetical protein